MKKTTYKKKVDTAIFKKINYVLILAIILFAFSQVARIFAPSFINIDNAFIQIKVQEEEVQNNSIFFVGAIILYIMMFNFLYHQIDKAEKGALTGVAMAMAGTTSELLDIIIFGHQVNYLKIGFLPTINFAIIFMILGWVIWIGSLIMYSSSHDLRLQRVYEEQEEELQTGKSAKMENIEKEIKKNKKANKKKSK